MDFDPGDLRSKIHHNVDLMSSVVTLNYESHVLLEHLSLTGGHVTVKD